MPTDATTAPRHRPVVRRGKPRTLALDPDADALLLALVPNSNGYGLLLSELIRREAQRRVDRPQLLAALAMLAADGQVLNKG